MASLSILADAELLRHAQVDFDPLTGTALEAELLRRFEDNAAITADNEPLLKVVADFGFDEPDALEAQLRKAAAVDERVNGLALLDLLLEFDIDDPSALRKVLERDAQLQNVLTDLASPLASLQALVTQE